MSRPLGATETQPAALVLCGGHSARMGIAKAGLPFGDGTMLQRVIDRLTMQCDPIVVVAAADQSLDQLRLWCPDIESRCLVARDRRADRGPLEGLIAGLEVLGTASKGRERWRPDQLCYATSCDVPLLQPGWITALAARIGDAQAAVPVDDRFHHPLATLYRANVLSALRQLDARDELRPRLLFDMVATVRVPVETLRDVDPNLDTLANLNTPADYLAAAFSAGYRCSEAIRAKLLP